MNMVEIFLAEMNRILSECSLVFLLQERNVLILFIYLLLIKTYIYDFRIFYLHKYSYKLISLNFVLILIWGVVVVLVRFN
jgi:hypothetical protein